jgi:hypothetical protein
MKTHVAYCSACDRDVVIAMTDEPVFDGQANVPDPEVLCLEIGHKCTGAMCPIGAAPPSVMAVRLVRSGLQPIVQPLVAARCNSCAEITKFAVIDERVATCTACGATRERATLTMPTSN